MSLYTLAVYLHSDLDQPSTVSADQNMALVIAVSVSLVILILLCAIVYITTRKRALHQLFEEFTDQQENWIENRVIERIKGLESTSSEISSLSKALLKMNKPSNEQQNLAAISLNSLMLDVKQEIIPQLAERQIHFSANIPEGINVHVNPVELKGNLKHLLTIAINSSPKSASLQVSVSKKRQEVLLKIITKNGIQEHQREHEEINRIATLTHDKLSNPQISTPYLFSCQMVLSLSEGGMNTRVSSESDMSSHLSLTADIGGSTPQSDPLIQHVGLT